MPDEAQAVTIKAPAFMETSVPGWFTILEAQFHLRHITSDVTKFYSVISALPAEVVAKLPNALIVATEPNYKELKEAVLNMHEKTKPELLERLMKTTSISGRPSVYLQEMLTTASSIGVTDDIVRHKFLQALPNTIAPVIASQKDLNLTQLGRLADELLPYFSNSPVMAVQQPQPMQLSQNFSNSYNTGRNYGHQGNNTGNSGHQGNTGSTYKNSIPYGLRPFKRDQRPKVCKAHIYYGPQARTCKPWCTWPNKAQCQMQPSSRPSSPTPSEN